MNIKLYQIYYDEASKANCFKDGVILYDNSEFDMRKKKPGWEYMENNVIPIVMNHEFIHSALNDYTGIISHRFLRKVMRTPEKIRAFIKSNPDSDVYTFFDSHNRNNFLPHLNNFHKGGTHILKTILLDLGIPWPDNDTVREVVYNNHFIATNRCYIHYKGAYLDPVMNAMKNATGHLKKLLWKDSGYSKLSSVVQNGTYYPMHTFVLERLFSIFLTDRSDYKVNHMVKYSKLQA